MMRTYKDKADSLSRMVEIMSRMELYLGDLQEEQRELHSKPRWDEETSRRAQKVFKAINVLRHRISEIQRTMGDATEQGGWYQRFEPLLTRRTL